jgi:hypothetical protein
MEKNTKILLVLGIIITVALLYYDIYLGGIVGMIFIALSMSLLIMQDSAGIPDIVPTLKEDAKGIILTNTGNARAEKIHVSLVPNNLELDIPSLEVDESYEFPLTAMIQEIKVIITFTNEKQKQFSRSKKLSVFGEEPDLLKPMFPTFKWKK